MDTARDITTKFFDMPISTLAACLSQGGISTRHAQTLFRKIYRGFLPFQSTCEKSRESLPKDIEASLIAIRNALPARIKHREVSRYDGSVKFIVGLNDGKSVEAVLIPESKRITLCVSSQVGCAQACGFCHTGRMGLLRNLTVSEIVAQVCLANVWISENEEWFRAYPFLVQPRISNVVFMGMGEPLDNVEAVMNTISIITEQNGLAVGLRKISVSTSGHLDGLDQLLNKMPTVPIALSIHSPFDQQRSQLMPINRRWPLTDVLARVDEIYRNSGRSVLIQYTIIHGVNDSDMHAHRLVELLRNLPVKVNLIPFNEIDPARYQAPEYARVESFKRILHESAIRVMVRYSKGQDIGGACGQLTDRFLPS